MGEAAAHGQAVIRATDVARNKCRHAWLRKSELPVDYMRLILAALCISAYASMACGQTEPNLDQLSASQPIHGPASSPDEDKAQPSPQGPTGPLTTGTGGVKPANPQGGTPPNMQPKSAEQK
jgi:hypothetical protein